MTFTSFITIIVFFAALIIAVRLDMHVPDPRGDLPRWLTTFGLSMLVVVASAIVAFMWPIILAIIVTKYSLDLFIYLIKKINNAFDWIVGRWKPKKKEGTS